MLQRPHAVVEVSPSRLEVAAVRAGRVIAAKAIHHEVVAWIDAWPGALLSLDGPLAELVRELDLEGAQATIIVCSPSAACGVFACAARVGPEGARNAAALSLGNVCGFDLDHNPLVVETLARDPVSGSDPGQTHSLGFADTDVSVSAIFDWARRAGLSPMRAIPSEAVKIAGAVRMLAQPESEPGLRVVLLVGEQASVLCAGDAERLRLVRSVSIGVEAMVEALTRPMSSRAAPDSHITLTRSEARALLWARGIPTRADLIDTARQLDGAAVLPLLQPVLQRLSVELKQSLRFGLSDQLRQSVRLTLAGPGAGLRNLGSALAGQSGLQFAPSQAHETPPISADVGPIRLLLSGDRFEHGLVPQGIRRERDMSRSCRRLRAGVAIAAALVAGDAWLTRHELRDERQRMASAAGVARSAFDAQQAIAAAHQEMLALEGRVRAAARAAPAWEPTLLMLADLAPPALRLSSLECTNASGTPKLTIRGYAGDPSATDAARTVKSFLDALESIPIFRGVTLSDTQRGQFNGRDAQRFQIEAAMIPPASGAAGALAGAPAEATP